ncbi:MAG: deoxyhypusine synthase family protein [Deltaproteobacteria bacterium]|nr:deoxyhypusine synthase family protein [Deltaproteobacteria bacterium]
MGKKTFRPLDFSRVRTYPLKKRFSKVRKSLLGKKLQKGARLRSFIRGLPDILAAQNLKEIARRIARAHRSDKTIVLGMGAHPIKVGLSPLIIDFMEKGIISAVAMNGAGIIHDFEIAFMGETSEDVAASIKDGSFGMAEETASFLNRAITRGYEREQGLGAAVGEAILKARLPHQRLSILATGVRLGIPVTVHVGIGTDIIHMHPSADGKALGEGSLKDFHTLASVVATLKDGVFLNLGSAVILPEVFLKALSLARNLGHPVRNLTTVNLDFLPHYRPLTNVVTRPTLDSGKGYHLTGHMEIMIPLLFAAILEEL